ncbi:Glycosyltransferase [Ignavibacterium album JCM 16511]|uniref:Glycosyltransferase n=1 Tax=Ignavibacterium album (strain DSM 19864 / JCM 16511 / NBRC 101810 / Mat9-16) TaxID=945713 RepID=I0AHJ7_IGNAJ|nr:glycosyltransferase family 1 protein [Ignavibacterium album]AFH48454.1 Glycosyltransferase [Ignavibacterium album JCM 16511]
MKIGIDARLLERKITGIGRFLIILLENFPIYDKENTYYLFTYDKVNFKPDFYKNIPTIRSIIPQKLFSPIWCNLILPFFLKKHQIDILFSVNQVVPLIKIKGCKYISVVHDVIYKADPSFLPFIYRKYLQLFAFFSVRVSDLIITVSEYSKSDILKHYKIDESKVKVVLQSANKIFRPRIIPEEERKTLKEKYKLSEKIVLYVGMIENRKNIQAILNIADLFAKKRKDLIFVLIGKIGYGGDKTKEEINKRENVIHLTNIDDETLAKFYNIADVFLFPSLYEGFGYPPLEAMQSGLPVIASDNTSLKEIVADGGILCNPNDYSQIYNEINKLLEDKHYREEIKLSGVKRAENFSLEKSVIQIVEIFNSLDNYKNN